MGSDRDLLRLLRIGGWPIGVGGEYGGGARSRIFSLATPPPSIFFLESFPDGVFKWVHQYQLCPAYHWRKSVSELGTDDQRPPFAIKRAHWIQKLDE